MPSAPLGPVDVVEMQVDGALPPLPRDGPQVRSASAAGPGLVEPAPAAPDPSVASADTPADGVPPVAVGGGGAAAVGPDGLSPVTATGESVVSQPPAVPGVPAGSGAADAEPPVSEPDPAVPDGVSEFDPAVQDLVDAQGGLQVPAAVGDKLCAMIADPGGGDGVPLALSSSAPAAEQSVGAAGVAGVASPPRRRLVQRAEPAALPELHAESLGHALGYRQPGEPVELDLEQELLSELEAAGVSLKELTLRYEQLDEVERRQFRLFEVQRSFRRTLDNIGELAAVAAAKARFQAERSDRLTRALFQDVAALRAYVEQAEKPLEAFVARLDQRVKYVDNLVDTVRAKLEAVDQTAYDVQQRSEWMKDEVYRAAGTLRGAGGAVRRLALVGGLAGALVGGFLAFVVGLALWLAFVPG